MKKKRILITNRLGLHLRPSSKLAQISSKYPCEVWISNGPKKVNAKSVLGITMLAASEGCEIEIECDGEEEDKAIHDIEIFFNTNFSEES